MKTQIFVDNLKCGGCANTVSKQLKSFPEVKAVTVDNEHEMVEVEYDDAFDVAVIKAKLASLGYPEKGTLEGIEKLGANAKSYISCAIGKLSN